MVVRAGLRVLARRLHLVVPSRGLAPRLPPQGDQALPARAAGLLRVPATPPLLLMVEPLPAAAPAADAPFCWSQAPHSSSWAASLRSHGSNSGGVRGPVACINSFAATAFFSDPEVQDAYHVKPPNGADDTWQFSVCGQASRDWRYRSTRPNLPRDTYPTLVRHMKARASRQAGRPADGPSRLTGGSADVAGGRC